jgi:hypothetical protein
MFRSTHSYRFVPFILSKNPAFLPFQGGDPGSSDDLSANQMNLFDSSRDTSEGDMSFFEPRPLLFEYHPKEVARHLAVRPGLSGWAQVNGEKLVSREEKRALDLWYIAHVSLMLEMWIVALILRAIIWGDAERPHSVRMCCKLAAETRAHLCR